MYPATQLASTTVPTGSPAPVVAAAKPVHQPSINDRLAMSRLGAFTGMFYAVRAKHPPTAEHSLRVALGCSKWAYWRKLDASGRDLLEIAALLHDVGKIGVPDRVLQKPVQLDGQESLMMELQVGVGQEMLRGAGASETLIQIVHWAHHFCNVQPDQLPDSEQPVFELANMLAIVDAYDSMTTEQVFRRALSRERAMEELCTNSGTQFDSRLVQEFAELVAEPRPDVESAIAGRWLGQLRGDETPGFGEPPGQSAAPARLDVMYHERLLETLKQATVYLDLEGKVLVWNRAAEGLTGRLASSTRHSRWNSKSMGLLTADGQPLESCPLAELWQQRVPVDTQLLLQPTDGSAVPVQFTAVPVYSGKQEFSGAILTICDTSAQTNLEQRVRSLHEIAARDPLTKVANRAELDRQLPRFLEQHLHDGRRGSLIICDIDYFKRINDRFGHQAGDDALVIFASLLEDVARDGDLVARFGGEEFVVLTEGCDNPAATARAEDMRRAVERTPVPALSGKTMTAGFGVTEIQPGDDSDTLLARADRALLMAKENGRNRVVQLGAGQCQTDQERSTPCKPDAKPGGWMSWLRGAGDSLVQIDYLAAVPKEVAVQKLKGFINDHSAELVTIEESKVVMRIDGQKSAAIRRNGERPAIMLMEVGIQSVQIRSGGRQATYQSRTKFSVSVSPVRARDRRSASLTGQAHQLLQSFQAYLVAQEIDQDLAQRIIEPR